MNQISVESPRQQSNMAIPSLGAIALNRMGFGPRPGDLDDFYLLGNSAEERLNNYH
jgi:hypothetical protein